MKKQIILTIILGIIMAFLIYKITYRDEMKFLVLGDSLAKGMTYYEVEGYSFNDYIKDYLEEKTVLREYITEFSTQGETSKNLLFKITNNEKLENTNLSIQKAISDAKFITISLGTDEFYSLKSIKEKDINNYLKNMKAILKQIRHFNKKKVIIAGLFPNSKLSKEDTQKINSELMNIAKENKADYIDIENINENKEYIFKPNSIYLNYKGHKSIANMIINNNLK